MSDRNTMKLLIFLTFFLILSSCGSKYSKKGIPPTEKGEVDLKDWDFKKNGPLELDGSWALYWKRFIPLKDVLNNKLPDQRPLYLKGSSLWDKNLKLPGTSYGTLIIKIKNLKQTEKLRIYFHVLATSSETFITDGNKTIHLKSGVISKNKENNIPQGLRFDRDISLMGKDLTIVIHIANFHYRAGGFYWAPKIYHKESHFSLLAQETTIVFFVIGAFFIVAVYHLAIFTQRRKDYSSLFLGLFCLVALSRFFSFGHYSFIFSPEPNLLFFILEKKFEYLSMIYFFPCLFEYLFLILNVKDKISLTVKKIFLYISLALSLLPLLLSPLYFTEFFVLISFQIVVFCYLILLMFFVIREVIKKTPSALTFLYSILLGAFGIIYDILVGLTILTPPEISPFTGIIFIFIQSHIVASNFGEDFQKVEKLTNQLNEEVDRKTGQIKDQNKSFLLLLSNLNQGFLIFNGEGRNFNVNSYSY